MAEEKISINLQMTKKFVEDMDIIVDKEGYPKRSDYIRYVVRKSVEDYFGRCENDYKNMSLGDLKNWLRIRGKGTLKGIILTNYREINVDEIKELLDSGFSKNKILVVYGTSNIVRSFVMGYEGGVREEVIKVEEKEEVIKVEEEVEEMEDGWAGRTHF